MANLSSLFRPQAAATRHVGLPATSGAGNLVKQRAGTGGSGETAAPSLAQVMQTVKPFATPWSLPDLVAPKWLSGDGPGEGPDLSGPTAVSEGWMSQEAADKWGGRAIDAFAAIAPPPIGVPLGIVHGISKGKSPLQATIEAIPFIGKSISDAIFGGYGTVGPNPGQGFGGWGPMGDLGGGWDPAGQAAGNAGVDAAGEGDPGLGVNW